jgi:tetratricopeptide (TPR) repeat protein
MTPRIVLLLAAFLAVPLPLAADRPIPQADRWEQQMQAGMEAFQAGRYRTAARQFGNAVKTARRFPAPDGRLAASLINLGEAHRASGDPGPAEKAFQEAVRVSEQVYGPDHPELALALYRLGRFYVDPTGRSVLVFYERRVYSRRPGDPPVSPMELPMHDPIIPSRYQAKHAKAAPLLERALAIYEKHRPGEEWELIPLLNDLAQARYGLKDYPGAEMLLVRSVALQRRSPAVEEIPLAITFSLLGRVYHKLGRLEFAEECYVEALKLLDRYEQQQWVELRYVLRSYADLLRETNREEKAKALEDRAELLLHENRPRFPWN